MTDVLGIMAGALVPIVGFMVRHYGRKAQAREKAMQESIAALVAQNEKLCLTVRSAYKRLRKDHAALRAQFQNQQNANG